jgi:hypothetical protein
MAARASSFPFKLLRAANDKGLRAPLFYRFNRLTMMNHNLKELAGGN